MPELPLGWEPRTLRDAALPGREGFIDGDWIEAPYITDAGIRLIQTGNLGVGSFIDKPETRKYISAASYRILNCTSVNAGDVLICRLADPIGRACEVPATVGEAVTAVDCTITRVDESRYDKSFLLHWLNSDHNLKAAADMAAGSTRSRISRSNLGRLPLPRPPLDQQAAIGRVLDTLDTTIRQTEAIIEKLKQVKQGLLHDLLTRGIDDNGELRPPHSQAPHLYKDSPLGWIPREWEDKPLGRTIADAYRYPSYFGIDYVDSGVPEVRGELIKADGTLDARSENYRYISKATATRFARVHLRQDDVVMSVRGTIGKFALVPERLEGAVITANLLKLTPEWTVVRADWLIRLLLSQRFQDPLDAACSSTTIKTIQVPELMKIRVAVPSLTEQQTANDRLNAIDSVRTAETAALAKLRLQKSGLMDDLLTGRVRVTPLLA